MRQKVTLKFKDGETIDCWLEEHVADMWLNDIKTRRSIEKFAKIAPQYRKMRWPKTKI